MTSSEPDAAPRLSSRPSWALWLACVRMQNRELRRRYPPVVALTAVYIPTVLRTAMWVLVGQLAGGAAGARFALTGAVVLAIMNSTVAEVSDIPMEDKWLGTYSSTARSVARPFGIYVARTVPLAGRAVVVALVSLVAVAPLTGLGASLPAALASMPLVVAPVISCTLLGLCVIAPAIGTHLDTLTYNLATAILTVFSGALIPLQNLGPLAHLGAVLPLQHGINAMRLAQVGEAWWGQLGLELLVGAGWGLAAWAMYRWQAHRARATGVSVY